MKAGRSAPPLAALTLLLGAAQAALATRPIKVPAPEIPPGLAWVNAKAFSLKQLRGNRVVMFSFLNTLTMASARTYPHLNRLWDLYNQHGLMILGVHTPDYDFDRDPISVRDIVKRGEIRFPVVIDANRSLWDAYRNEGWPAHYLIDDNGQIIHDRLGEGNYAEFEDEILKALRQFRGYTPPKDYLVPPDTPRKECGEVTQGFYLGERRGKTLKKIRRRQGFAIVKSRDGEVAVSGRWATETDAVRSKEANENMTETTRLRLIYQGAESVAVLTRTSPEPARLYIKQNNLWLHSGNGHKDVAWDDDDRSYVLVDQPRLYRITRNKDKGINELMFYPGASGIGIASFEFSDRCQVAEQKAE